MTIKNGEIAKSSEVIESVGRLTAQQAYERVKDTPASVLNVDYLGADIFTSEIGEKETINTSNSTANYNNWDVSTLDYDNISEDLLGSDDLFFKPDGTKLYVIENVTLTSYTLSTPWDISTATQTNQIADLGGNTYTALFFKPDGTKLYVIDAINQNIEEWTMSSYWDISTATKTNTQSSSDNYLTGIHISNDGRKRYNTVKTENIFPFPNKNRSLFLFK